MWLSARLWTIALIVLCLLPACGYQLTAQSPINLPAGNTKLFLKKVTNPTTETWFEPTGQNDETLKSKAMVHLEISFYSADTHALIWNSGPVVASESYRGTGSKRDATQKAIDLAMRIAADRLSQNF